MMDSVLLKRYNETAAKAAYLETIHETAKLHDLSDDIGPHTIRLSIVFTVIAVFFVTVRFFCRWKFGHRYGWDDWLILVSVIMLIGNMVMNIVVVRQGLGKHAGALTLEQRQRIDKTLLGCEIMYLTSVSLFKLSLLCLYARIFPVKSVRVGGYILGSVAISWTIACNLAAIFQCTPRNKLWEPWLEGTCINLFLTFLCVSVPNILCDIGILCLPMPQVWKLQTNFIQKVFLTGIFLLGSYVVFTSIYRFRVYLLYDSKDMTYSLARGAMWNVIEISSGIVSSCLPTLGPLMKLLIRPFYSTTKGSSASASLGRKDIVTFGNRSSKNSKTRDPYASLFSQPGEEEPTFVPGHSGLIVSIGTIPRSHNCSGDEIPLTSIRQQTKVEWKEKSEITIQDQHCDYNLQRGSTSQNGVEIV
ncbi:integral membrane protein [Ilyonectria robusta]